MKRRAQQKERRSRRTPSILVCAQCGESGPYYQFRQCSRCGVNLHRDCIVHHHVDHAGDGVHNQRDYSNLKR